MIKRHLWAEEKANTVTEDTTAKQQISKYAPTLTYAASRVGKLGSFVKAFGGCRIVMILTTTYLGAHELFDTIYGDVHRVRFVHLDGHRITVGTSIVEVT